MSRRLEHSGHSTEIETDLSLEKVPAVALESLEHAVRRNATILAEVVGVTAASSHALPGDRSDP